MIAIAVLAAAVAGATVAPDPAQPAQRTASQREVQEILDQPRYKFCHAPNYPLHADDADWCLPVGNPNASCQSYPDACKHGIAWTFGGRGRLRKPSGANGGQEQTEPAKADEEPEPFELPRLDWLGSAILYLLGAIAIGGLIFGLIYLVIYRAKDPDPDEDEAAKDESPASAAAARGPIETDVERLLARARACAARGEFDRALDFLYAALLRRLDGDGLIRIRPWRTNGDYLRDLRARPDLHGDVRAIVREIERVQFGAEDASQPLFASLYEKVTPIVSRALAAIALLLMVGGLSACGDKASRGSPDDAPTGRHAVEELLTRSGLPVRPRLAPIAKLGDESATLLILSGVHLDAKNWDTLLDWVKKGHTLVVASGTHHLPSELGLDEHETGAPDGDARVPSDQLRAFGDLHVRLPDDRWLELRGGTATPLLMRGDKPYAAAVVLGEGAVIVLADDHLLENVSLAVADNAAFLVTVMKSGKGDKIAVADETTGQAAKSPAASVTRSKLAPFTLQLALLFGLFLLYKGAAFGTLRDPPSARRREFVEHVRALGAQYAKARATRHAVALYATWALDRMREVGGKGSLSQLADAIARRTGRPLGETMRLILEARAVRDESGRQQSPEDLLLMRELGQLMHELGGTREHRRA